MGRDLKKGTLMKNAIEAYGVKGMGSKRWVKGFKSLAAMNRWLEKNDAVVIGCRWEGEGG
jgi:hypothetical protein